MDAPSVWCVLLLIIWAATSFANSSVDYAVDGEVSSGNYSYYRLTTDGHIILTLLTHTGDADVYVSDSTLHPTFDTDNHCLQSVTCGDDVIDIPSNMKRPVAIGIYGHPSHDVSKYSLHLRAIEDPPENPYDSMGYEYEVSRRLHESYTSASAYKPQPKAPVPPVEDESILWTIFIGLLKVLLEVLT